jgi:hypothetical protein
LRSFDRAGETDELDQSVASEDGHVAAHYLSSNTISFRPGETGKLKAVDATTVSMPIA